MKSKISTQSNAVLWPALLLGCFVAGLSSNVNAQTDLEMARSTPPRYWKEKTNQMFLEQIDWRLRQKQELLETYLNSREQLREEMHRLDAEKEALMGKLPQELRSLDQAARSRLAGSLMEQVLDIRLELATRERMLEVASKQEMSDAEKTEVKLRRAEVESQLQLAAMMVQQRKEEYERAKKLASKEYVSSNELKQAEYQMQAAEAELRNIEMRLGLLTEQAEAEKAKRIADQRIEIEPLRARLRVATEMMDQIASASEISRKIDSIEMTRELLMKDLAMVAEEMGNIGREASEFEVLQRMIRSVDSGKKEEKADNDK